MFVFNFKMSSVKKVLLVVCLTASVLFGFSFLTGSDSVFTDGRTTSSDRETHYAPTNEERVKFLSAFGWETSGEPTEITEVIIPSEFSETYEKYNEIQLSQGLDLRKYKNKRIKRYSYEVKNYPGEIANIRANLLIYDGMIVGGDVCSIELGGFMHGFQKT